MAKLTREQLIENFLDQVAEFFDAENPVAPMDLMVDPIDGETVRARDLFERIRLGKNAKDVTRG